MATFDGLVLRRCLYDRDETLHAGFYWHELAYRINGMSVSCLRTEDTLEESIFSGKFLVMLGFCCILKASEPISGGRNGSWCHTAALRVPLAVTWLTVHRQLHISRYDGCLFAIFSVAVCRIATSFIIVLDIDNILPHAKGHDQCIPVRGAVSPGSSSHETRKSWFSNDAHKTHRKHSGKLLALRVPWR